MAADNALAQGMAAAQHTLRQGHQRRNFQAPAGSAVVENPNNGQIVALATNPSYNPAIFVGGISHANYNALLNNPSDPLLDRTIQGQYAPGSTFKLITATAGLKYGIITPNSLFHDTGSIQIGNFTAHNDNGAAYGWISLQQAITVSSDNFFNNIGLQLWYGRNQDGQDALQNVAKQYGLGQPTGIDLPNEAAGKIPTPQSYMKDHQQDPAVFQQSQWYPGNSDQVAIGQDEVLVTPVQLANAYATFANGGNLYAPVAGRGRRDGPTGKVVKTFAPEPKRTVALQPAWRAAMLAGFRRRDPGRQRARRPRRLQQPPESGHGHRRQDGHGPGERAPAGHLGVHVLRPGQQSPLCGRRVHGGRRLRRVGGRPGRAGDLRRPVRRAAATGDLFRYRLRRPELMGQNRQARPMGPGSRATCPRRARACGATSTWCWPGPWS